MALGRKRLALHRAIRVILRSVPKSVRVQWCDDIGELAVRQWYEDSDMFAEARVIRPIAESLMHLQGRAPEGARENREEVKA